MQEFIITLSGTKALYVELHPILTRDASVKLLK